MAQQKTRRRAGWEYWTTVTYRSVMLIILSLLIMAVAAWRLMHPESFQSVLATITGGEGGSTAVAEASFARFVNLDGQVRVKKRDSVQWINADYRTPLEEGDIIRTGSEGIARVTFTDGTTYVVKPDTLIVIEQNARLEDRTTKVAVQLNSGAVDLSTGSWEVPGSTSELRFEDAVARMQQNTRASVRQDPESDTHQITVSEGSAQVQRGQQAVRVGPYERASFRAGQKTIRKEGVIAPPELQRPRNLEPIISSNPRQETIRFQWSQVKQAERYRLRISTSPLFTSMVEDKVLAGTSFSRRSFAPGEYYWTVRSIDARNQESQESEPNSFTLAEQPASEQLLLVVENTIQHGRVIEIVGRTEPGASVTINAEPVAYVGPDGRFRHFTSPLPGRGAHTITIVAQNRRGEVVTRKQPVLIK